MANRLREQNAGPVYTNHTVTASMKIKNSGELHSTALCNIHGLWEYSKTVAIK